MFRRKVTHLACRKLFQRWVMFRRRVFTHHHVGVSRLDSVFGLQFVLPNGLESDCRLNTGSELPYGNVMFRRNITYLGNLRRRIFIHGYVGDSRLAPVF
ncbi:MAG: hypothetical protein LBI18_07530 [Planctomycetaceae bacterium]|nr:hypothetical protein [Planctomycetaceae bacterium]